MTLADVFDANAHYLQPAVDRNSGTMLLEDYKAGVLAEKLQLWAGEGFAAVTEVINYPQRRTVVVLLAGGDLDAILGEGSELEQFAEIVGATAIEIVGRKGWARVLRDRGYAERAVYLIKEL